MTLEEPAPIDPWFGYKPQVMRDIVLKPYQSPISAVRPVPGKHKQSQKKPSLLKKQAKPIEQQPVDDYEQRLANRRQLTPEETTKFYAEAFGKQVAPPTTQPVLQEPQTVPASEIPPGISLSRVSSKIPSDFDEDLMVVRFKITDYITGKLIGDHYCLRKCRHLEHVEGHVSTEFYGYLT